MKYCNHCGFSLNDNEQFCPSCGTNQQIVRQPYGNAPASGGKGTGIAACILGSLSMASGLCGVIDGFIMLVMRIAILGRSSYRRLSAIFAVYPLIFGVIGLICGIIGLILSIIASAKGFRKVPTTLGRVFAIVGLCLSVITLMIGFALLSM